MTYGYTSFKVNDVYTSAIRHFMAIIDHVVFPRKYLGRPLAASLRGRNFADGDLGSNLFEGGFDLGSNHVVTINI